MEEELFVNIMYYGLLVSIGIGITISYIQAHNRNLKKFESNVNELIRESNEG